MAEISVARELTASGGRYVGRIAGVEGEAELTFSRAHPQLVVVDHTGTPDAMRDRGVATALVNRLIADARSEGFKIRPLCSFVQAQFERHPDWSDLRA